MSHLLVVEDDRDVAFALERLTAQAGYTIDHAGTIGEAHRKLETGDYDAVLLDLGLPDGDSLSLATVLRERRLGFVVISGRDDAHSAVSAMKAGAADYLTKPFSREALGAALDRAVPVNGARARAPRASVDGHSAPWLAVLGQLATAARAPRTPVLLRGETGTGKEVLAQRLHAQSERAQRPFVAVNAACLGESLAESELFGHEAGAFTDAKSTRRGVFELAHKGTLFLDEVGELPLAVQAKLLRVLETQRFRRVGGEKEITVDVRVIAATHRALEVPDFRADLLQRLAVFEIALPPLRERGDDCVVLAELLLSSLSSDMGIRVPRLSASAVELMLSYDWPGNVRELKNALERALLTAAGAPILEPGHFTLRAHRKTPERLNDAINDRVARAVAEHGGNLSGAARALGISRNRLKRHLNA